MAGRRESAGAGRQENTRQEGRVLKGQKGRDNSQGTKAERQKGRKATRQRGAQVAIPCLLALLPCCLLALPAAPGQCVAVCSVPGTLIATEVVAGSGASGPDGSWMRGSFRSI